MDEIVFLCGCRVPIKVIEYPIDEDTMGTRYEIDGFTKLDSEGLLLCGEHHARRHGYRSLPTHTYVVNDEGDTIQTNREDFRFASLPYSAIEQYVLFDIEPVEKPLVLK